MKKMFLRKPSVYESYREKEREKITKKYATEKRKERENFLCLKNETLPKTQLNLNLNLNKKVTIERGLKFLSPCIIKQRGYKRGSSSM